MTQAKHLEAISALLCSMWVAFPRHIFLYAFLPTLVATKKLLQGDLKWSFQLEEKTSFDTKSALPKWLAWFGSILLLHTIFQKKKKKGFGSLMKKDGVTNLCQCIHNLPF